MQLPTYLESRDESVSAFTRRARAFYRPRRKRAVTLSISTINRLITGEGCHVDVAYAVIRATQDKPAPDGGTVTLDDLVGCCTRGGRS